MNFPVVAECKIRLDATAVFQITRTQQPSDTPNTPVALKLEIKRAVNEFVVRLLAGEVRVPPLSSSSSRLLGSSRLPLITDVGII